MPGVRPGALLGHTPGLWTPPSAGAAAFDPAAFGTVVGWWKADAIAGKNDGDAISSWTDSSAAANNLTQATGTKQPLYKTAIQNGLPAVRFDGVDDRLLKAFTYTQPAHVFVVCVERAAFVSNDVIFSGGAANSATLFRTDATSMTLFDGSASTATVTTTPQSPHVYSSLHAAGASENRVDGGTASTGNPGGTAPGGVSLGALFDGTFPAPVDIFEVIAFSTTVTTGRTTIENYLKRWGTP